MKSLSPAVLILCLAVAGGAADPAWAWGPDGHRSVCRIAYLLLDDADRAEVVRLTEAYRRPDGRRVRFVTEGCVLPDEARANARKNLPGWEKFNEFNDWHFLNLPRTSDAPTDADCHDDCVLTGIAHHTNALRTAANDQDRAEALFFLGHWVGDVHQPLHVSYSDDLGGNNIDHLLGNFYTSKSLHSVWDSGILGKAIGTQGWRIHADGLKDDITPPARSFWLASASPLEWARESYVITTQPGVEYCAWASATCASEGDTRTLGQAYQDAHADEVQTRIQQAGVRLADILSKNLRAQ